MSPAAFVQFRTVDLDPPPNATGADVQSSFLCHLRHLRHGNRIPQIPPHAPQDDVTGIVSPLERIGGSDGHVLPYQISLPGFPLGGGSWSPNGVIVFSPRPVGVLFRVPATGGKPERATKLDQTRGELTHRFPEFLPDGRLFLYIASFPCLDDSTNYENGHRTVALRYGFCEPCCGTEIVLRLERLLRQ
jgi:hypothetical protein